MPALPPSIKFSTIYNTLPPNAQRILVEKHLAQLLDSLSSETANHVVSKATELQSRLRTVPVLDLKDKKREVGYLLEALVKDAKTSIVKENSSREELLSELVESLIDWLNDIWSTVYEYNDNYLQAHACLLYSADVLSTLADTPGIAGCKCSIINIPVNITIKRRDGKVVKSFSFIGPNAVVEALLWIWRDLFVSLSAYGTPFAREQMPEMLEDIETLLGWPALERLLYGGKNSINPMFDNDDDDDDESIFDIDDDGDEDYVDEDEDVDSCEDDGSACPCAYHAEHWPGLINEQRTHLRNLVEQRLIVIFETRPCLRLYNTLTLITDDAFETTSLLNRMLVRSAGNTAETLVAALNIYAAEHKSIQIAAALDSHSHLLRPRDAETLQVCAVVLGTTGFAVRCLTLIEKELNDCVRCIHAATKSTFCHMNLVIHKKEFAEILKLRLGTQARRDRIERWVDAIISSAAPMNPMASFAAMMMGLPMAPGMEEGGLDAELAFLDLDGSDSDLEDIREEFRPRLKDRFVGWCELAASFKRIGSAAVLSRVYTNAVTMMPFIQAHDAVQQMLDKLRERPSKAHVSIALESLTSFCKAQRKKNTLKAEKQRRANEKQAINTREKAPPVASASAVPPTPPSFPNGIPGFSFSFTAQSLQAGSGNTPTPSFFGGMADVD